MEWVEVIHQEDLHLEDHHLKEIVPTSKKILEDMKILEEEKSIIKENLKMNEEVVVEPEVKTERVGIIEEVTEVEIEALRDARTDAFADPAERLVADTAAALVARGDLSDVEFAAARDGLGLPMVFELTTLVGYYATLALQLRVFRVESPLDTANGGRQDSD